MMATSGEGLGAEWILLAFGGVMTLAVIVFFIVVLSRKDKRK